MFLSLGYTTPAFQQQCIAGWVGSYRRGFILGMAAYLDSLKTAIWLTQTSNNNANFTAQINADVALSGALFGADYLNQ